ncbi:MAG: hypothetical protein U0T75_14830 [Chitinophagales bacterium]
MRETLLFKILLYTHIVSGMIALASGAVTLSLAKGGKLHRRIGLVFFMAMLLVSFSALAISIITHNNFLLAIAVFSFYMNFTGYRFLQNKIFKYQWFDWAVLLSGGLIAGFMVTTLNTVLVVFGALLSVMVVQDVLKQTRGEEVIKQARRRKVLDHIGRMVGTYIATCTAFLVVNVKNVNPAWLPWLLPTFIGTPFIFYWVGVWKKKLKLS